MADTVEIEEITRQIDRLSFREPQADARAARPPTEEEIGLHRILVGLDGSRSADNALEWARAIAGPSHASVHPATVLRPSAETHNSPFAPAVWPVLAPATASPWTEIWGEEEKAAKHILKRAEVELTRHGIAAEPALAFGGAVEELARLAKEKHADLVVLGSRGRGQLESMLLGSVADGVKNRTDCSVLIAKTPPGKGTCVIATDGSQAAQHAAAVGLRLAGRVGLRPVFLHVIPPPGEEFSELSARLYEEGRTAFERDIRARLAEHKPREAEFEVHFGQPARTIVETARKHDARLIVMGTRGLSGIRSLIAGSVSNRVAHEAACSVLLVKEGRR